MKCASHVPHSKCLKGLVRTDVLFLDLRLLAVVLYVPWWRRREERRGRGERGTIQGVGFTHMVRRGEMVGGEERSGNKVQQADPQPFGW